MLDLSHCRCPNLEGVILRFLRYFVPRHLRTPYMLPPKGFRVFWVPSPLTTLSLSISGLLPCFDTLLDHTRHLLFVKGIDLIPDIVLRSTLGCSSFWIWFFWGPRYDSRIWVVSRGFPKSRPKLQSTDNSFHSPGTDGIFPSTAEWCRPLVKVRKWRKLWILSLWYSFFVLTLATNPGVHDFPTENFTSV